MFQHQKGRGQTLRLKARFGTMPGASEIRTGGTSGSGGIRHHFSTGESIFLQGSKKIRRSRSRFLKWLLPWQMMHPQQIDVKRRKSPEKCRSFTEEIPSGTVRTLEIGGADVVSDFSSVKESRGDLLISQRSPEPPTPPNQAKVTAS